MLIQVNKQEDINNVKKNNMVRKGKLNGRTVWILDKIKTTRGDDMIYYRNLNSNNSDVRTKVIPKRRAK